MPTIATLISSTLANILTVVGTALLIRMLGGDAFGNAALLTSAATTLGTVTSSGICLHILRTTARDVSSEEVRIQVWIGTFIGQGIAALITVVLMAIGLAQEERTLLEYLMICLSLHFTTSDALSKNRLVGAQRLMHLAGSTIFGSISTVSLQLVGAWIGGPQGYMVGFTLGTGLQAIASWIACHAALPPMGAWPQGLFRRLRDHNLFEFVTLATLSASIVPLAHWLNSLIAAHKMNNYGEVATLTVAMQFFNMVIFVPTVINKLVLPKTIKADVNRDVQDSRRSAFRQAWRLVFFTAPILPLVWALSGPITNIYHFPSPAGTTVILIFVGASVLACAAIPLSNYFVSHSKMNKGLVGNLIWAATYLSLAWVVPGGAAGAAISLLFAYAINLVIALHLVKVSHNEQ